MSFLDKYGSSPSPIARPQQGQEPQRSFLSKFVFPPPPAGSIPQAKVLPEEKEDPVDEYLMGLLPHSLKRKVQAGQEVAKEGARNLAGVAVAPFQAARHPIATGLDVIPSTVNLGMGLAEMVTPLDAGNFPGHQAVNAIDQRLKEKIARDAPFEEAGQYAAAVPDVIGIKFPLAGVTKVPAAARAVNAAGGVAPAIKTARAARAARAAAAADAPARGRAVFEATLPRREELSITDVYLREGSAFGRAVPYFDNPASAPTPNLRRIAHDAAAARSRDATVWGELSRGAQDRLVELGAMKASSNPNLQRMAQSLDDSLFKSGAPQAGQLQDLTSGVQRVARQKRGVRELIDQYGRKARLGQVGPTGPILGKTLGRQQVELAVAGVKERALDIVRGVVEGGFSRPGSRIILAARTPDAIAQRILKTGIPGQLEQTDAMHRAFSGRLERSNLKLIRAIDNEASGDLDIKRKLAGQAFSYVKRTLVGGKAPPRFFPPRIQSVVDDLVSDFENFFIESARLGVYTPTELKNLRAGMAKRLTRMFQAAHDPGYLKTVKDTKAWQQAFDLVKRFNPGANDQEIVGALEQLVSMETAQYVEEYGKFPTSLLSQQPGRPPSLLRNVPQKALGHHGTALLGRIRSLPTVAELAGETMARARAERLGKGDLIEALRPAGLVSDQPIGGWVNISELLKTKGPIYAHPEIADLFPQAPVVAREALGLTRRIAKAVVGAGTRAGARWRIGSTLWSPTTSTTGALSNLGGALMDGTALHRGFLSAAKHAYSQAGSVIQRGGHALNDVPFEDAMAMRGLGAGTQAGELGSAYSALGMTPRVRHSTEISPWMANIGVSAKNMRARKITSGGRRASRFMRDVFEQGDIAPKRIVASIHASEFNDMIRLATPGDEQRIFREIWGSTNPGEIAADITSNVMQSYQRVAQWWKDLGKTPLMGLFSSFPYESSRNFSWGIKYLVKELRSAAIAESPAVRQMMLRRAGRRVAGMSLNMRLLHEIGDVVEEVSGVEMSDEEREAFEKVVLPEWDKGPFSIVSKKGSTYTYNPTTNVEYFQNARRLLEHAGAMVGAAARGEWNRLDDAGFDLLARASDDLLQWQQPLRGVAETVSNKRIAGSIGSMIRDSMTGRRPITLSDNPIASENWSERIRKGLYPGIAPTPVKQVTDIVTGKRGPMEILPLFRLKSVDTLQQMGIAGNRYADERQTYNRRLAEIGRSSLSPEEQAREIAKLRRDWNDDFGPKLARELEMWRRLHSPPEVLKAMKELGHASAVPAMQGRVPDFDRVFAASIPKRAKFFLRGER